MVEEREWVYLVSIRFTALRSHYSQQKLGAGILGSDEEGANFIATAGLCLTCEATPKTSLSVYTMFVQRTCRAQTNRETLYWDQGVLHFASCRTSFGPYWQYL